ncbi:hypothetical protein [Hymenobacter monticola]|uniref:hypothetical protein n=1 Tax=Hymenobacter monticola TaxID=1705399 RepID=UPI0036D304AF
MAAINGWLACVKTNKKLVKLAILANGLTFAPRMNALAFPFFTVALPNAAGLTVHGIQGHHHHLWGAGLCAGC